MHFYCFLPFFVSESTNFTDFSVSSVSSVVFFVAHPGARTWCHALPWWAVCCSYPRGLQQPKQNNTQIMKYAPAKGVEPSQVHAGHGMG